MDTSHLSHFFYQPFHFFYYTVRFWTNFQKTCSTYELIWMLFLLWIERGVGYSTYELIKLLFLLKRLSPWHQTLTTNRWSDWRSRDAPPVYWVQITTQNGYAITFLHFLRLIDTYLKNWQALSKFDANHISKTSHAKPEESKQTSGFKSYSKKDEILTRRL